MVVGVVTPGACACVHHPPRHRQQRLDDPPASLVRRGQRRPRLQCLQVLLYSVCKRYATSLSRPHRCTNGMRVSSLEEAPGDAPARRESPRCRGDGVWRRWRTTAMLQRRHACHEECESLVRRASPRQVLVALRRHRGVACGGGCSERRHAFGRHRIPRCAFRALSCLRDRGVRWTCTRIGTGRVWCVHRCGRSQNGSVIQDVKGRLTAKSDTT
jgi:hypothetical protein